MKELSSTWNRKTIIAMYSFLLLLMVIGSIWDYPFSQAVYNQQNPFGIFFAAFGEAPAMLGLVASGLMLILGRNKERKGIGVFQICAGIFLLALGSLMMIYMPSRYLENAAVAYILGLLLVCAAIYFVIMLSKSTQCEMMIRVALTFFLVVLLEMVLVNIIKIPWGRPRMRLIAEHPEAYFTDWWVVGGQLKNQLISMGIESEEFKSFPSGHTANGAALMLLSLLPLLNEKLKNKGVLLFCIGAVWGLLVALSRIIVGAHFITDTVVGFSISYTIILVFVYTLFLRGKKV